MAIFPEASAWLDAFRDDPEMRIDHLLRQWDAISPFERNGGGDSLIWSLKAHGTTGDAALVDHGLAQWLKARVMEPLPVVLDTGWNAYVTDLIEAFSLAARLPMPETGALLRSRYEEFDGWTEGLSHGDESGDVRTHYLTALAHNQNNRRFKRVWFGLCDKVGRGRLPEAYLDIGLMGLRLLPTPDGSAPIAEEAEGLALWADHLDQNQDSRDAFELQWQAFKEFHDDRDWRTAAAPLYGRYAKRPFAAWWRDDLAGAAPTKAGLIREPSRDDTFRIIDEIRRLPWNAAMAKVERFVAEQERYAQASGSAYTLSRAFNVLGNAVLRMEDRPEAPPLAERLAVMVLDHDANHEQSCLLWSKALRRMGGVEAAEAVLWRVMQNKVNVRTELADAMTNEGRIGEAEALHRDTIQRFSDNVVAPVALAKLLADNGRAKEAEALYRDTSKRFPSDPISRLDLGLLLLGQGRPTVEVQPLLDDLVRMRDTAANTLRNYMESVERGEIIHLKSNDKKVKILSLDTEHSGTFPKKKKSAYKKIIENNTISDEEIFNRNEISKHFYNTKSAEKAINIYRETMELAPMDPGCRLGLGFLLIDRGHSLDDVQPLLDDLNALGAPEAIILQAHMRAVRNGQCSTEDYDEQIEDTPKDMNWAAFIASGDALHAEFLLSPALNDKSLLLMTAEKRDDLRETAKTMLRAAIKRAPNNPVVRLIAARYPDVIAKTIDADAARRVAGGDFGLRLELALRDKDEEALGYLFEDFHDPGQRAVAACGWLWLNPDSGAPGAEEAAEHLRDWLATDAPTTTKPALIHIHDELRERLPFWSPNADRYSFLESWDSLQGDKPRRAQVRALIDVALLGLVLAEMPMLADLPLAA